MPKSSPGQRPRACQTSRIVVFFIKSSIFFDTWPSPGSPGPPNARPGAAPEAGRGEKSASERSKERFFSIFERPRSDQKNVRFPTLPRIGSGAPKINLWPPKAPFLMDFHRFLVTFLASFFHVFAKLPKSQNYNKTNRKTRFLPSQNTYFWHHFSIIFLNFF